MSFLNNQPVLKEVKAISDYPAQYADELTFRKGDRLQVLKEGFFPRFQLSTLCVCTSCN